MLRLAMLPEKNDYLLADTIKEQLARGQLSRQDIDGTAQHLDLIKIDTLDGLVVTLIKKDYHAVSPKMWNAVYEQHGIPIRRVFAIAEPTEQVMRAFLEALQTDPKFIGGGAGSG